MYVCMYVCMYFFLLECCAGALVAGPLGRVPQCGPSEVVDREGAGCRLLVPTASLVWHAVVC